MITEHLDRIPEEGDGRWTVMTRGSLHVISRVDGRVFWERRPGSDSAPGFYDGQAVAVRELKGWEDNGRGLVVVDDEAEDRTPSWCLTSRILRITAEPDD